MLQILAHKLCSVAIAISAGCAIAISGSAWGDDSANIKIVMGETDFVIPHFANPFMERDSGIVPHEYELAEKLRGLLDNGSKQAALAELDAMMDLELSPALLHLKGQIYFTLGEYEKAKETFGVVLLRMPQFVRAHSDLGQVYMVGDEFEKAREHFAKAISYGENSPIIYGQLGYLNLKLNNGQSAIAAYQNALAMEPTNPQWQQGLLAALSQSKNYLIAIAYIEEMLAANPESPNLWLNKAYLHLQQEDDFKALASLETALALGNSDPENELAAAQLHLQLSSIERALELLTTYIESRPVDIKLINQISAWLEADNRWTELNKLLATYDATSKVPNDQQSDYQLLKARVARGLNDHNKAARHYTAAIDADPTNVVALISAADYHYSQAEYIDAETLYTRAQAFEKTKKDALMGRARIYLALKDFPSALDVLREARAEYPDMPELSRNIAILESTINAQAVE